MGRGVPTCLTKNDDKTDHSYRNSSRKKAIVLPKEAVQNKP
jgi:hypothetical protein